MWGNIKRFAGDRINDLKNAADTVGNEIEYGAKQLRDETLVPALDSAMEAGVLPPAAGMYGRYLTGTEKPLTKMPPAIKKAEKQRYQNRVDDGLKGPDYVENVYRGFPDALQATLGQYTVTNGVINDRYDFNDFQKPGDEFNRSDGPMSNGIQDLMIEAGGKLSHQLGLIKPGSGYEVKLDTGRR